MLEHGAYTLLIDACYDRERFPTIDEAYDWCWARSDEEKDAVLFVLNKFFVLIDGKHVQSRITEEIENYHNNSSTNARIAKEREEKRRTNRERTVNEPPPNQEPRTINQEPLTNNQVNTYTSPPAEKPPKADPIPYEKILNLYHQHLPKNPRAMDLTTKRKGQIAARWKSGSLPDLETWEKFFIFCGNSKFLTGQVDPINGHKRFVANIEWLTTETHYTNILERKYHG